MHSIKTIFDLKSFIIFLIVTAVFGFSVSKMFDLSFIIGCIITGGAILVNGLIIALTENKNDEKDE